MNKCPKTVTGKHYFIYQQRRITGLSTGEAYENDKKKPKICKYCEIINDAILEIPKFKTLKEELLYKKGYYDALSDVVSK